MKLPRLTQARRSLLAMFPERHLYLRSGGEMRAFVLTPGKQMAFAAAIAGAGLWMGVSTAAMAINALSLTREDQAVARTQAKYERWAADRQARLNSAMVQLSAGNGSMGELASSVENRHQALAMLLTDLKDTPGAQAAQAPALRGPQAPENDPVRRVEFVRASQERLIDAADTFAKSRAERLRLAFRLAGVSPSTYAVDKSSLGGPLIEAKDPRALAAILDVEEDFATRIQHAANSLSEAKAMTQAAESLPLARPSGVAGQSSGFGVRFDPFTRRPAFHSGLDFTGGYRSPIGATAPGTVSFTGVRSGYGNTVEIDHGKGFKTRYAHLAGIAVRPGQRVALGQRIGAMGSTGRSTGVHLHYEVWVNGRAQNPSRFLKAGEYVQQASKS